MFLELNWNHYCGPRHMLEEAGVLRIEDGSLLCEDLSDDLMVLSSQISHCNMKYVSVLLFEY